MLRTDPALLEPVPKPQVEVRVNEDLDKKALRLEAALAECNARIADVAKAQEIAVDQAKEIAAAPPKDQPAPPWWRRLMGGGK